MKTGPWKVPGCALVGALLLGATASPVAASAPAGPLREFRPGQPWPDTTGRHLNAHGYSVLFHDGTYYWYGSHKMAGRTESEKNEAGVRCYTSSDLLNWTDAGLVLDAGGKDMDPDVAEAGILDRPKVILNVGTGKFVMYFKLYPPKAQGGTAGTDVAYVGVAVADKPTGPFRYHGKFIGGGSPNGSGDFAIYQETDGAIYHVAVRKPDKWLVYGRLSAYGLGPVGDYRVLSGVTRATEAPALFRRRGRLYLLGSGSTGWAPNAARLFVADRLAGNFQSLGNPARGVNPHNGLGADKTFGGQSTFVLPIPGYPDAWIAMFDMWDPQEPIKAGYIWLPLDFSGDRPVLPWRDRWDPGVFGNP